MLNDFEMQQHTFEDSSKTVFKSGEGPAVIVMSEMPGIYDDVVRFARFVRDAGFTVYLPHMFGEAGREPTTLYTLSTMARTCISREFSAFAANRSSPVIDWLRALARHAHGECGGKGVGAIGMCFTGNFAFNLMLEPAVLAPVLSQPSLPIGKAGGIHIAPEELRCIKARLEAEDLTVLAYRFEGDNFCKDQRFEEYSAALGDRFIGKVLPDNTAKAGTGMAPHSVVTRHLVDEAGQPTRQAVDEILNFYQLRLKD